MTSPERSLWQAVVYQAFVDATAPDPSHRESVRAHRESVRAKRDAHDWISGSRSFRTVCALAGMDPDFLSEAYRAGRVNRSVLKSASKIRGAA